MAGKKGLTVLIKECRSQPKKERIVINWHFRVVGEEVGRYANTTAQGQFRVKKREGRKKKGSKRILV